MIPIWVLWLVIAVYVGMSWLMGWSSRRLDRAQKRLINEQHRLIVALWTLNNFHQMEKGLPGSPIPDWHLNGAEQAEKDK